MSRIKLVACLLALAGVLTACATGTTPVATPTSVATALPHVVGVAKAPEGKYLFIETTFDVDGIGKLRFLFIDFPTYVFNPGTGMLGSYGSAGLDQFALSPTEWGLVGYIGHRTGAAGSGISGALDKIASLPLDTTIYVPTGVSGDGADQARDAPLKLVAASADGTLEAEIDGERVVLAPGRAWSRTLDQDVSTNGYIGRYMMKATLTNYGWQERAKIQTKP